MVSRKLGLLLLVAATSATCGAATDRPRSWLAAQNSLAAREQQFWTLAVHNSNFSSSARAVAHSSCEAVQPPEALPTPDPLLDTPGLNAPVTVSVIVGIDGRVHSPLILESLGPSADRIVLDTVLSWRYRPATCNGVPTEAEGKIAFSSR